jgi:alpha-mannosidase
MYPDREQIDVRVVVDWREQLKMLKLRFPVNLKHMKVTRESAYGHIEFFANGDECPVQSWVDVSGTAREKEIPYGLSVLNDGKYSLDVNVHDIGLTLLRSPAYAHHIPAELNSGERYVYIDQGIQHFNYTLLPHSGSWETAGTARRAVELNQPMIPLFVTSHPDGKLHQSETYISVEPENIMVTVLKQAEDDDALIVRAVEISKSAVYGEIDLPQWERTIAANFDPCEIKTFRVPRDPDQPVSEVNLLEWPM